jgi:hypothetical protein
MWQKTMSSSVRAHTSSLEPACLSTLSCMHSCEASRWWFGSRPLDLAELSVTDVVHWQTEVRVVADIEERHSDERYL